MYTLFALAVALPKPTISRWSTTIPLERDDPKPTVSRFADTSYPAALPPRVAAAAPCSTSSGPRRRRCKIRCRVRGGVRRLPQFRRLARLGLDALHCSPAPQRGASPSTPRSGTRYRRPAPHPGDDAPMRAWAIAAEARVRHARRRAAAAARAAARAAGTAANATHVSWAGAPLAANYSVALDGRLVCDRCATDRQTPLRIVGGQGRRPIVVTGYGSGRVRRSGARRAY